MNFEEYSSALLKAILESKQFFFEYAHLLIDFEKSSPEESPLPG